MNCFNHPQNPAVGICKSCGKGLCVQCATELPNGLACEDACEDRVSLINHFLDLQARTTSILQHLLRVVATLFITTGLSFMGLAIWHCILGRIDVILVGGLPGAGITFVGVTLLLIRLDPKSNRRSIS